MLFKFSGLFFTTLLISQTCKLIFRKQYLKKYFFQELVWVFIYGSGPPSSHTAVITSSIAFIGMHYGINSPYFIIICISGSLWIYEMYMQRLRFYTIAKLLSESNQQQQEIFKQWSKIESKNIFELTQKLLKNFHQKNKHHRKLLLIEWKDLSGHDFLDLIWGLTIGLTTSTIYYLFFIY